MPLPPLLIQFLFHPRSSSARQLAQRLHGELNSDPLVPGLRIPTLFGAVSSDGAPREVSLEVAARTVFVPLADDEMTIDDRWGPFIANIWTECQNTPHRCLPIQLTATAWPIHERLRTVNFARAFSHLEGKQRDSWVMRRIITELCRVLRGLESEGDTGRAPLQLFLSHAKCDLGPHGNVISSLINSLTADQPVDAWVDSGEIETGSEFAEAIERGVKRTSLLAVLTDNYSSREWCREEVMLAKEHQRPFIVVDALESHEVRSFPFLENVPKIRWKNNPQACIDLLLKESLRNLHTRTLLEQIAKPDDIIFLRPPEPAMLLGMEAGQTVLYSDPPLGVGELKRLSKSRIECVTPLQRSANAKSLRDCTVALSMSENSDIEQWGLDNLHLQQTMLDLSQHLLVRGATLAYGGHIGPAGYAQPLLELVRSHNHKEGVKPFERIVNTRGWPAPLLSTSQKAAIKSECTLIECPRPTDVDESLHPDLREAVTQFFPGDDSVEHRFAWCRGMTEMRAFQADRSRSGVCARIVLGGVFEKTLKPAEDGNVSERWYFSRMPGVLEEVLLSIKAGQPVFLIGCFGGAAKLAIDLILGRQHRAANWDVQSQAPFASEVRELYRERGGLWWYYYDEPRLENLATDDPRSIVEFLTDAWEPHPEHDWETSLNPLTKEQNLELFTTPHATRIIELTLQGLTSLT